MFLANFRGGVPRVQMDFFEFFLHKSSSTHRYFKGEYSGAPGAPVFTLFEKVVLSKFEFNLPTHYYTNTCALVLAVRGKHLNSTTSLSRLSSVIVDRRLVVRKRIIQC